MDTRVLQIVTLNKSSMPAKAFNKKSRSVYSIKRHLTHPHKRFVTKLDFHFQMGTWGDSYGGSKIIRVHGKKGHIPQLSFLSGLGNGACHKDWLRTAVILDLYTQLTRGTGFTLMFTDDANVMREVRKSQDCINLQMVLDKLQSWSDTWMIKLNPSKCKIMVTDIVEKRPR